MKKINYISNFALIAFVLIGINSFAQTSNKNVDGLKQFDELSQFTELLSSTRVLDELDVNQEYTILAPVNSSFESLAKEKYNNLPNSKNKLRDIATYHIIKGAFSTKALMKKAQEAGGRFAIETLYGQVVYISESNGTLIIVDHLGRAAKVQEADIKTANGVVFMLDGILLPAR